MEIANTFRIKSISGGPEMIPGTQVPVAAHDICLEVVPAIEGGMPMEEHVLIQSILRVFQSIIDREKAVGLEVRTSHTPPGSGGLPQTFLDIGAKNEGDHPYLTLADPHLPRTVAVTRMLDFLLDRNSLEEDSLAERGLQNVLTDLRFYKGPREGAGTPSPDARDTSGGAASGQGVRKK